jgi:hypothetical protein
MPQFSKFFSLKLTQHQLDFVDVNNERDTPVYVDPYAIEIRDDIWAERASGHIRSFFKEVLDALREENFDRAANLMSHLTEPRETFLGVSRFDPNGRGVGPREARKLIRAIATSKAYKTGLLSDLSEMALYVEGIDRDKISDLTTNVIRNLLVEYTNEQCEIHGVPINRYSGPPMWDIGRRNWVSREVQLPYIEHSPVLLVPKYIVRRRLSIDSQEFYNKQITDFLVAEHLRANSSLVHVIKRKDQTTYTKVYKGEVREHTPKSKSLIAEMVGDHPGLLDLYKKIAKQQQALEVFDEEGPTITSVCKSLASAYSSISPGAKEAEQYHKLVMGSLTALFYPDLIQPHKEWDIHDGRKRIDIVFTNAADVGFFAQRRSDHMVNANTVIVECKNYSKDIANPEVDQLIGRFDNNRGKLGIITCRKVDKPKQVLKRCRDAASRSVGYMLVLADEDLVQMLTAKSELNEAAVEGLLHAKYRELLS